MTRKLTLIVGIAVTALAVGVPTAFGEGQLASLQPSSSASTYRDANERGKAQQPSAFDRAVANGQLDLSTFRNTFDQAGPVAVGSNLVTYRDGGERSVPVASTGETPVVGSGRDLEWPQIGIGLAIGIVLVFGLWLAVRATRIRPLAH